MLCLSGFELYSRWVPLKRNFLCFELCLCAENTGFGRSVMSHEKSQLTVNKRQQNNSQVTC